jgi:hypothetical protein
MRRILPASAARRLMLWPPALCRGADSDAAMSAVATKKHWDFVIPSCFGIRASTRISHVKRE